MKINPYTAAIQNIHAPASAVENALQNARRGASQKQPVRFIKRLAVAAAIVLLTVGAFVLYGVFVAPSAAVYLESRESVILTLNSRGNVLSATDHPALSGRSAAEAVKAVAEEMLTRGALDTDENTLILGTSSLSDDARAALSQTIQSVFKNSHFDGAIICLSCSDNGAKAAVADLLTQMNSDLTRESLRSLSANDLNLLLHDSDSPDGAALIGTPSASAYIGFDAAAKKALSLSGLSEDELSDISVTYSVYHGRLIYLVRLNAGDNSEAYFINALTGATEQAIKAPSSKMDAALKEAIDAPQKPPTPSEAATYAAVSPTVPPDSPPTEAPTDADNPPPDDPPTDPPQSVGTASPTPTEKPTAAESAAYTAVPVSMKELSFVTLTPPDAAHAVSYQTIFEGQYLTSRDGDKGYSGEVAVITNLSQLRAFLKKYPYAFTDQNGEKLKNTFTASYFNTRFILASACTVSDASYRTTVTDLKSDGRSLYMENSFSYGAARSGEFTCRTLSLYSVSRTDVSPNLPVTVY